MNIFCNFLTIAVLTLLTGCCNSANVSTNEIEPSPCDNSRLAKSLQSLCELSDSAFLIQAEHGGMIVFNNKLALNIQTLHIPKSTRTEMDHAGIEITHLSMKHNSIEAQVSTPSHLRFLASQSYIRRIDPQAKRKNRK